MKKLLMVGAADVNGRKAGGVSYIVKQLSISQELFRQYDLDLEFQNSCLIKRNNETVGSLSFLNFLNAFSLRKKIFSLLSRRSYQYVFIHSSTSFALAKDLWIIKSLRHHFPKTRFFIEIHSSDPAAIFGQKKFLQKYLKKNLVSVPSGVVFLSDSVKRLVCKIGLPESRAVTLYSFVMLHPHSESLKEKFDLRSGANFLSILYLGAIYKEKGFYELLSALKSLAFKYRLVVCGEPRNALESDAFFASIKGDKNIVYKGFVDGDQKEKALLGADVMVLPSYSEGLPVSLLEGIAYGCYIIASDVGAIPEVFQGCGEVIHGHSALSIKMALDKCQNKKLLRQTAEKNIIYSERFSLDSYVRGLVSFFNRCK